MTEYTDVEAVTLLRWTFLYLLTLPMKHRKSCLVGSFAVPAQ